jgi:ribosome-binding protein aMBF1 (putative translation factor)
MRLTPEQQAQAEQARQEGRRSVHFELTEEQRADQQQKIAEEEGLREENIAAYRRRRQAEVEPGLAGDLRRAITAARRRPDELAAAAGISVESLEDFREGSADLPLDVVDKLAAILGLRLMAEIRA